jgi:hypothetical protein
MAFFSFIVLFEFRKQPPTRSSRLYFVFMNVFTPAYSRIALISLFSFSGILKSQNFDDRKLKDSLLSDHTPNIEILESDFPKYKSFMFRRIRQEYIANENGFLLDVKLDTAFIHFERQAKDTTMYTGTFYQDADATKPFLKANDIEKIPIQIKLAPNGKIAELVNWTAYRDYLVTSLSKQAKADLINGVYFNEQKNLLNKEPVIRNIILEDINALFSFYGDTVDLNLEYLRIKGLKSPFTQQLLQVLGNLKIERMPGATSTLRLKAQNKASGAEKQQLMDEAIKFIKGRDPDKTTTTQILNVGLNSEQEMDYNTRSNCLMSATLSDVVVLNTQSRGNVRVFHLWDYRYSWEKP